MSKGVSERVSVSNAWPVLSRNSSNAVIVVNAAVDHERSIEWGLLQDASILVEKPLTLSVSSSRRLIENARRQGVYIAAAHVFLFADYLINFKKKIQSLNGIVSVDLVWADALREERHGEAKSFDPGLRIFEDCIPHVMSIMEVINPGEPARLVRLEFLRGGAQLELELTSAHTKYTVHLVRNGPMRRRVVTVADAKNFFTLDFSREPGTITNEAEVISASPNWDTLEKPLSQLLTAFFDASTGGGRDRRLETELSLRASNLSEEILLAYQVAQSEWIARNLLDSEKNSDDLCYAINEICASSFNEHILKDKMPHIVQIIKNEAQVTVDTNQLIIRPMDFIKSVLNKIITK